MLNSPTQFKDSAFHLTYREELGHLFEVGSFLKLSPLADDIQPILIDPREWKENIAKGPDIILHIRGFTVAIDCKFTNTPIFDSWILRDYIPRFEGIKADFYVILTNNKFQFTRENAGLLSQNRISLMDIEDLTAFLSRLGLTSNSVCDGGLVRFVLVPMSRLDPVKFKNTFYDDSELFSPFEEM